MTPADSDSGFAVLMQPSCWQAPPSRQLGAEDEEEQSAEDPELRSALERANQLYGKALQRLA